MFSAATSGLVLVGGIWLKYVVDQQLKLKDSEIGTLNTAIKLHESQIAALKAERAPAIAAEYKTMLEHAEKMTAEKQRLDELVKTLKESNKRDARLVRIEHNMAERDGLTIASSLLMAGIFNYAAGVDSTAAEEHSFGGFTVGMLDVLRKIDSEIEARHQEVRESLEEIQPKIFVPLEGKD